MSEFEEFILAIDRAMKDGARAEVALRAVVARLAEHIRQRRNETA
jgi:predicted transcriptional regulator